MPITDHGRQLDRMADDVLDIDGNSFRFGSTKTLNYVLFFFEVVALVAAGFHAFHGQAGMVLVDLCVAVGVLVFHATALLVERRNRHGHDGRVGRLVAELRWKAQKSAKEAEDENLKVKWPFGLHWRWP